MYKVYLEQTSNYQIPGKHYFRCVLYNGDIFTPKPSINLKKLSALYTKYFYGLPVLSTTICKFFLFCQLLFAWSTSAVNCYFHGQPAPFTAISMVYLCSLLLFPWSTCAVFCYFHGLPAQSTAISMVYLSCQPLFAWSTWAVNSYLRGLTAQSTANTVVYMCSLLMFHGLPVLSSNICMVYLSCQALFAWSTCAVNCYFHGLPAQSVVISMVTCAVYCYLHGLPVLSSTICMVYLSCQALFAWSTCAFTQQT